MKLVRTHLTLFSAVALLSLSATVSAAPDADAARALAKKNDCFKCHALDKSKKGPSYKKIAAKYKGKEAEGMEKMLKNVTTVHKVKLEDGSEEEHKIIEATPAETDNLLQWILTM
ncbi:MAG: cytochrome C [Zoogloeaceae bacterium]|jgi:cytochrome c|nr:cytochrome C [Zoogloeaceae bacterium]